ncbi:hypothetical protein GOP47_0018574 [Adiantum capillus-veneris]|uniref:Uncharacterized protein n=1 Tax=Adiantum capillus-veneris TaxID=13818 RepID=A0A9D4Z9Q7_ADICA|nr:hypothetical protein GOP47_0018574 [Adiantum capillus-veneris]
MEGREWQRMWKSTPSQQAKGTCSGGAGAHGDYKTGQPPALIRTCLSAHQHSRVEIYFTYTHRTQPWRARRVSAPCSPETPLPPPPSLLPVPLFTPPPSSPTLASPAPARPPRGLLQEKQDSSSAAPSSIRRGILAGIVAAGSALAVFSNNTSMAAIGPGNEGACRTAEKADELLKAADKLNIEDAPRRYGPGRPGPVKDPTKISQIAGTARDAIGQADTKSYIGDDLGKAEGGVLKPFQQGLKNLKETVERTGADARSTVADVVSKNTP